MHRTPLLLLFAAVAGHLAAQAADPLEIRGTALEVGSDGKASLPVEGIEVDLIEFIHVGPSAGPNVTRSLVATAYTDPTGVYRFHPEHTGDYWVEMKNEGYRVSPQYGAAAKLDATHSTAQSNFKLTRLGGLVTGRVVDEDGQPVAGLQVIVQTGTFAALRGIRQSTDSNAVTAADGTFTAMDVLPGAHVLRIIPRAGELEKVEPHFSPDDLDTVDQDFEMTYWPGGAARPTASIPVSPGGSANAGTIKVHQIPTYRVHVSVPRAECKAGEKWTFNAIRSDPTLMRHSIPCTSDFLVKNLGPGTYSFLLQTADSAPGMWAQASLTISNKNVEVILPLEGESQIVGRVVAADGATLPPLDKIKISTRSYSTPPMPLSPDAEGKFVFTNLKFPQHEILVQGLTKDYYVKEFRFNGASSPNNTVMLSPGAANKLEIVIDDKPGAISGTVTDGDKPAARARVILVPQVAQSSRAEMSADTDPQGRFRFTGLTPGEYQVAALPQDLGGLPYSDARSQVLIHAETIDVERGGTQSVSLKLAHLQ
ncbi:MAG TPA: carboxypeptidase-like regulatory domain-containing protein [Bryobacteraceae bacterium]|jgi:hypothetical protein